MSIRGWQWALDAADSHQGLPRIPASDQLGFTSYGDGTVAAALRAHGGSKTAYLYVAKGVGPSSFRLLRNQFAEANWCTGQSLRYSSSGLLVLLHPCPSQPQGVRSG